jgi:hypothetical protein
LVGGAAVGAGVGAGAHATAIARTINARPRRVQRMFLNIFLLQNFDGLTDATNSINQDAALHHLLVRVTSDLA